YRDIVRQFSYVVETERRFYLANQVDLHVRNSDGEVYFEVEMHDAWVWDMYRPARFVKNVRVMTFKDVNVEELEKPDISLPTEAGFEHGRPWIGALSPGVFRSTGVGVAAVPTAARDPQSRGHAVRAYDHLHRGSSPPRHVARPGGRPAGACRRVDRVAVAV